MIGLYFVIIRHERVFGVLGKDQDDQKTMEGTDEEGLVASVPSHSDDKHEDDQPQGMLNYFSNVCLFSFNLKLNFPCY